ncbi:MAG: MerR family transcriptional regulator [Gammaproteobacteria bacterium]|nr:MerR family transcriptional regulator [Gammaproteobacteria bacterium]
MPRIDLGFTSRQVSAVTGLTLRQLHYWRKTGLVPPSRRTRGGHARYSFTDLVALRAAAQLLDAGISLRHIRRSIGSLQQLLPTLKQPLAELSVIATGDVVLVFRDGIAFEAMSGQEWILPLAELQRQLARLGLATGESGPQQGELFGGPDVRTRNKRPNQASQGSRSDNETQPAGSRRSG